MQLIADSLSADKQNRLVPHTLNSQYGSVSYFGPDDGSFISLSKIYEGPTKIATDAVALL